MKSYIKLLIISVIFCIAFSIVSFANGVSLTVESKTVSSDTETVSLAIELSGNTGLSGLELSMSYTEGLVIKEIVRGGGLSSMSYTKPNDLSANPITLLLDAETDDNSDGTLYNITFQLPKESEKEYYVNLTVKDAYDFDFNDVDISVTNGKITVEEPLSPFTYLYNSLILDGSLGMKVYFEYENSVDTDTMVFTATLKSSDSEKTLTLPVTLEDDGKTAYSTVYLAPKDIDNFTISSVVTAKTTDGKDATSNDIPDTTVLQYIEIVKELAKSDETCAKALNLVVALETYCSYADKYFDKSVTSVEEIALSDVEEAKLENLKSPARIPEKELGALSFHSTSLILEDKVTLRHYFKINGEINLNEYTVSGASSLVISDNNEGYAYVDVENISADKLSEQKSVTVNYKGDNMQIKFSPLNYVGLTFEHKDAKLRNLAKALYRYSVEADLYINGTPIIPEENETEGKDW